MIELNLLPDVKLEYIRAQKTQRLVISMAVLITMFACALLIIVLSLNFLQNKHLADLSRDISRESKTLQTEPNINRVLTVQNQLQSLTDLHNKKPAATRVFDYLNNVTPAAVNITNMSVDFTKQAFTITGQAASLADVNTYVDTLKTTTYKGSTTTAGNAFTNVVLTAFGLTNGGSKSNKPASYTIGFGYDQNIFDTQQSVTLTVPKITARSALQSSSDLFQSTQTPISSGGSN